MRARLLTSGSAADPTGEFGIIETGRPGSGVGVGGGGVVGFINVAVCLSLQSSTTSLVVFSIRLRYVFRAHPLLFCLRKLGRAAAAQELGNLGRQKISQKRETGTRGRREIFFFFCEKAAAICAFVASPCVRVCMCVRTWMRAHILACWQLLELQFAQAHGGCAANRSLQASCWESVPHSAFSVSRHLPSHPA